MKKLLLLFTVLLTAITASAENYILYTSSDGQVVSPTESYFDYDNGVDILVFGAKIVSNTYEDGQGKILFDGDVTVIGNCAFDECYSLTSVQIPSSVTEIGGAAFRRCFNLSSVEIPNSVKKIGNGAFDSCI